MIQTNVVRREPLLLVLTSPRLLRSLERARLRIEADGNRNAGLRWRSRYALDPNGCIGRRCHVDPTIVERERRGIAPTKRESANDDDVVESRPLLELIGSVLAILKD